MSAVLHAVEGAERAEWPAPDMALVDGRRRPAPALPLQVFGPFWSQWIVDQAEAKSAPPDYVAAGLLSVAGAVIGNARWSSPWDGWQEPPTLWTAGIGTPSSGKSPGLDAPLALARQLEAGLNAGYPARRRAHETKLEEARAARDAWTAEVKRARKDKRPAPSMPDEAIEPERPERRRLVATDATIEALGRLLAANPRGLLYCRDELAGWLGSMDRYANGARGADRAFFLESFSGRPFVIDRVRSADPLPIPRLTVAVTGGIQPDRLASGVLAGDDDGLAARFLYFWPEPVPPRRPTRTADEAAALAALRRLLDLELVSDQNGEPQPRPVPFTPEAATVLQEFREANAVAERGAAGLFLSWLGKLPGIACRLALVLEHLWWAGEARPDAAPPQHVSRAAILAAVALIDAYLVPMAERTFGDADLPRDERSAATLARWLLANREALCEAFRKAHDGREPADHELMVNARALHRRRPPGLKEPHAVRAALSELVEAGWLVPRPERTGDTPGRKREDYLVNPRIWGDRRAGDRRAR